MANGVRDFEWIERADWLFETKCGRAEARTCQFGWEAECFLPGYPDGRFQRPEEAKQFCQDEWDKYVLSQIADGYVVVRNTPNALDGAAREARKREAFAEASKLGETK